MNKPIVKYYMNGEYHEATVRDIGDLDSLKTAVKTDIVSAINSITNSGGTIPDNVQEQLDSLNSAINEVKDDVSKGGLNSNQLEEVQGKLDGLITITNESIAAMRAVVDAEIKRVEQKADSELSKVVIDYNSKVNDLTDDVEGVLSDISSTQNGLKETKEQLQNVELNYVEVEKSVDVINGELKKKVNSSDFELTEATVNKNSLQIEQNRKGVEAAATRESLDLTTGRVREAEAKISLNAEALKAKVTKNELREEIDKIDKFTPNLLRNTRDWNGWESVEPAKVSVSDETYNHCHFVVIESNTSYLKTEIDNLVVGQTYTASIDVKSDEQGVTAYLQTGKDYIFTTDNNESTVSNQWKRLRVSFVAEAVKQAVAFRVKGLIGQNKGYLAAAKIEKSKTHSPWQAHFDDVYEKVIQAEAEIGLTSEKLAATIEKTETIGGNVEKNTTQISAIAGELDVQTRKVAQVDGQVQENKAQLKVATDAIALKVEQSDIDKSVGDINLDNRNRVLNSDFSRGMTEWVQVDKGYKLTEIDGVQYLSINRMGLIADLPAMATTNMFPVQDKGRLMISADIIVDKYEEWDVKKPLTVEVFDINDKRVAVMEFPLSTLKGNIIEGKPSRVHGVYVINREDAAKARVKLSLTRNGSLHFTKISAQLGDIGSTDWSLAPEDTRIVQASLKAQIDVNAEAIRLKAESSEVSKLGDQVSKQEAALTVESEKISAVVSDIERVGERISNNESSIEQTAKEIKTKLSSTQLEEELGKKNYVNHAELSVTANGFKQEVSKVESKVDNLKVGGKNFVTAKSVQMRDGRAMTLKDYKWSWTNPGVPYSGLQWWRENVVTTNTKYVIQFKFLYTAGEVTTIGGHISFGVVEKIIINGKEYPPGGWLSGTSETFLRNTTYDVRIILKSDATISQLPSASTGFFIEPNRNAAKTYTMNLWDFQIKEGDTFSSWDMPIEDVVSATEGLQDYIVSRGQNLVTNGFASLGDNTNFPGAIFDGAEREVGAGAFKYPLANAAHFARELIPVDTKRVYSFEYYAKSLLGKSKSYAALAPFDVDKKPIAIHDIAGRDWGNSTMPKIYKLTKPLKVGDTEIWLDTVDGIRRDGSKDHWNSLILWGYKNSFGYEYPVGTYSRLYFGYAWDSKDIDNVENKITFSKPFDFKNPNSADGIFPVGHELSMTNSGSGYMYPRDHANIVLPKEYRKFRHLYTLNPEFGNGMNGFNSAIAFLQVGWLLNREVVGDTSWINGVTFSDITDASNADSKADEATERVTTLEQTSEKFKVQVSALETVSNNLDTTNLIQMGDFEGDTVGAKPLLWSGGLVTLNSDKVNPPAAPNKSEKSLRIIGKAGGNVGYYATNVNNEQVRYKVEPGDSFYVEFWTRWTDPSQKGEITFGFRTFDSAGTGITWLTVSDSKVTSWKKVTGTITIPEKTYYVTPYVSYDRSATDISTIFVDNLKIIRKVSADQVDSSIATTAQLEIKSDEINLEVGKKVSADKIIASFNLSPEAAKLTALKINLTGAVTFASLAPDTAATFGQVEAWKSPGTTLIDGGHIKTNSIDTDKLNVTSLSAIAANLGTVTAGLLKVEDGSFYIDLKNKTYYSEGQNTTEKTTTYDKLTIKNGLVEINTSYLDNFEQRSFTSIGKGKLTLANFENRLGAPIYEVNLEPVSLDVSDTGNNRKSLTFPNMASANKWRFTQHPNNDPAISNTRDAIVALDGWQPSLEFRLTGGSNVYPDIGGYSARLYVASSGKTTGNNNGTGRVIMDAANVTFRSQTSGVETLIEGNQWSAWTGSVNMYVNPANNGALQVRANNYQGAFRPVLASAFQVNSQREAKTNIESFIDGLSVIRSLQVRQYNRKTELAQGNEKKEIGLILDESPEVLVAEGMGIDMYPSIGVLFRTAQQLDENNRKTDDKVELLEERVALLEGLLNYKRKEVNELLGKGD